MTRSIALDLSAEELWHTLIDTRRWPAWLGVADDVDVRPGGAGCVLEADGTRRRMVMERVDDGRRLVWRWWPEEDDDQAEGATGGPRSSTVELVVTPAGVGASRLTVTETMSVGTEPGHQESVAWDWEIRLMHLAVLVLLLAAAAHLAR